MAGSVYPDVVVKELPPNTDLSSRCEPMQAHDLKNGHWVLGDKSGVAGTVENLKMSKTGKHGHAKFTYKIRMPHSGKSESCMHPGGDYLWRPVMEKCEYQFSHIEEGSGANGVYDVVAFDSDFNEVLFKISSTGDREPVYQALRAAQEKVAQDVGLDIILTVLEGPRKTGDDIDILQLITDVKVVAAQGD